ncbi:MULTISPECIES: DUF424 domain-containing protein [Metallosphaera]|uniref:DUF424 domain-containing protein n=3 Tax=Metallosphaera TaxID=41980 RepID=A4YEI2_METS5|nr:MULTISPECIES: DUF424 family protein [Metallosphaera]ABP94834.1 protein of unknown function DUF424 [Metallosphaera sedula DSM 5348]AIM26821.1 protein of unknown function DUF424 [Metallosphaera sedula]AKV73770.1 hypothetical protein MsedA_0672 [Metallosphaera sedula]AKV76010.1 hypothetical protein MsedB_0672 [Metallosphaera sedula]AKV78261.1 hypothetical protein MsedC_0671 [Metallosphaera sedula]
MRVILKIIRGEGHVFVNICEKEYLGREFRESKAVLNVNNEFYGGEEVDINYALDLVDEATVVSIVGERAIGEAIKRGLVHKDAVLTVSGVKFAQIYNL